MMYVTLILLWFVVGDQCSFIILCYKNYFYEYMLGGGPAAAFRSLCSINSLNPRSISSRTKMLSLETEPNVLILCTNLHLFMRFSVSPPPKVKCFIFVVKKLDSIASIEKS